MKVMILKTDERLGIEQGEVYEAEPYSMDPSGKVSLLARVPDGYEPMCNQYRNEVARKIQGRWHEVSASGQFVPTDVEERSKC